MTGSPGPGLSPQATVDALALVPAYGEADRIAATVEALAKLPEIAEILVVDDADDTATAALAAGAHCLVLPSNRGKGAALNAGLAALINRVGERVTPRPRALLLADGDLGDSAGRLGDLLAPVLDGEADLAIADLPAQEGAGGFGLAMGLARAGIRRRTGRTMAEPLSGQRAIRWEVLESGVLGPFAPPVRGRGRHDRPRPAGRAARGRGRGRPAPQRQRQGPGRDPPPGPPGRRHRPRAGSRGSNWMGEASRPRPGRAAGASGPPPGIQAEQGGHVSLRALPLSLLGLAVGWGAGRWGAPHLLAALSASSLSRTNYRKRVVVAGLGLLLPLGLLAWAAPLAVANRIAPVRADLIGVAVSQQTLAVLIAGLAFALLGLIDDLADDGSVRGFRGHLSALAAGQLTGGGAKLLGGGLAALVVATLAVESPRWLIIPATILVASAANVANLFDLRPGRCAKVFLPLWMLGAILAPGRGPGRPGWPGRRSGCSPASCAKRACWATRAPTRSAPSRAPCFATGPVWLVLAAAAVLLALQLASERISFTKVIEANRWLRAVDRLGRLPD